MVIATQRISDVPRAAIISHTMLAQEGDKGAICTPYDILDRRRGDLRQRLLLLNVVQDHRGRRAEDQTGGTTVEDLVCLHRWLDALDHRVRQVAHFNKLTVTVQRP